MLAKSGKNGGGWGEHFSLGANFSDFRSLQFAEDFCSRLVENDALQGLSRLETSEILPQNRLQSVRLFT
jgi:hypothetical protein